MVIPHARRLKPRARTPKPAGAGSLRRVFRRSRPGRVRPRPAARAPCVGSSAAAGRGECDHRPAARAPCVGSSAAAGRGECDHRPAARTRAGHAPRLSPRAALCRGPPARHHSMPVNPGCSSPVALRSLSSVLCSLFFVLCSLFSPRHPSVLRVAIDAWTASALFLTSASSASLSGNSITRSTPPAPSTTGTPKKRSLRPYSPSR